MIWPRICVSLFKNATFILSNLKHNGLRCNIPNDLMSYRNLFYILFVFDYMLLSWRLIYFECLSKYLRNLGNILKLVKIYWDLYFHSIRFMVIYYITWKSWCIRQVHSFIIFWNQKGNRYIYIWFCLICILFLD